MPYASTRWLCLIQWASGDVFLALLNLVWQCTLITQEVYDITPVKSSLKESLKMNEIPKAARYMQNVHSQLLNGSSYDLIPRSSFAKFEDILAHYLPVEKARMLSNKIISVSSFELKYRIILVHCKVDDALACFPVIKVSMHTKELFYDHLCRKYDDWNGFLHCNKHPGSLMIYPLNGSYPSGNGEVELKTTIPPTKVAEDRYQVAEFVSMVTIVLPIFSFAKPLAKAIKLASGLSEGYKVLHHSGELIDLHRQGQPVWNFSDKNVAFHWSHIGNSLFSFGLTWMKLDYGTASPKTDLQNFITITKKFYSIYEEKGEDPTLSWSLMKGHLLSQYMLDLKSVKLPEDIFGIDLNLIVFGLKNLLGVKKQSLFRKIIYVDNKAFTRVLDGIKLCKVIDDIVSKHEKMYVTTVDESMKEVNEWKRSKISDNQLRFRVNGICQYGKRRYETLEELRPSLDLEEFQINGKLIFQNVGGRKLELKDLVHRESRKYPQLLWHAVEYASKSNVIDWDNFKAYFIEKIHEEYMVPPMKTSNISWINALNFEENSVLPETSTDSILFLRPNNNCAAPCTQDFIELGKRLLRITNMYYVDMLIVNTFGTIMISKLKKKAVFIGREILEGPTSLLHCYPVYSRHLFMLY